MSPRPSFSLNSEEVPALSQLRILLKTSLHARSSSY
uniref:Uncharacterized protein n=1 Tax=Brassica campestris TaxID=3711 RepID=A0A3P6AMQ1_BRACM|nr:unnamed protein product [Brassica rapa]